MEFGGTFCRTLRRSNDDLVLGMHIRGWFGGSEVWISFDVDV